MNPDQISTLIESNRYNIEILPQLENYVQYQIEKQTYNFESNLTVLKFYQFHPEKTERLIVGNILVKALMNLPSSDFALCMYLIPERLHTEEPIQILITLANLLESSQFEAFWVQMNLCKEFFDKIPGFYDSIRGFIIGLVSQTYRTISKATLSELVNMKGTDLDALVNARDWKQSSSDDTVTFPTTDEITAKQKKLSSEHTKIDDLSRILTSLRTPS